MSGKALLQWPREATIEALHLRGMEIDLAIECCEACQRSGLCRTHEVELSALADAAQAHSEVR